jgi:hypothetical protein
MRKDIVLPDLQGFLTDHFLVIFHTHNGLRQLLSCSSSTNSVSSACSSFSTNRPLAAPFSYFSSKTQIISLPLLFSLFPDLPEPINLKFQKSYFFYLDLPKLTSVKNFIFNVSLFILPYLSHSA